MSITTDKIKASVAVVYRAAVVGAVGGMSSYLASAGIHTLTELRGLGSSLLYAGIGGLLGSAGSYGQHWVGKSETRFGRGSK